MVSAACVLAMSVSGIALAGGCEGTTGSACAYRSCPTASQSCDSSRVCVQISGRRCVRRRPCARPTCAATARPTAKPTQAVTAAPTATAKPTQAATAKPTETAKPTQAATAKPTETAKPTQAATAAPTATAKPTSPAQSGSSSAAMAWQVFEEVNRERAAAGLAALELDDSLSAAAQIRADEITRSFSHTRPDGSSFSTVTSGAYGENIAKGQSSAARVMAAWMSSSGHRANILNARYTKIGICAYEYGGVMYWVQLFGR